MCVGDVPPNFQLEIQRCQPLLIIWGAWSTQKKLGVIRVMKFTKDVGHFLLAYYGGNRVCIQFLHFIRHAKDQPTMA